MTVIARAAGRQGAGAGESVLFLHIPKTAGTTLQAIISRQYPAASIYTIGTDINRAIIRFRELPDSERRRFRVVQGHMSFGLHAFMEPPAVYVTLLREPVSRTFSDYRFVSTNTLHPLYATVKSMSLAEYLQSGLTGQLSNGQTRLLSGDSEASNIGIPTLRELGRADLRAATENLERHFAVVGLQERFDETLLLMQRRLGWQSPVYVRRNVTPQRGTPSAPPPPQRRMIEAQNQLDIELYRYACDRFEESIREAGPSFQGELETFRSRNRRYQLLSALGWRQLRLHVGTLKRRLYG